MRTTLMMASVMAALCAVGAVQKPPAKKTSLSESELRTFAKADPDIKNAGVLYLVAKATTNNVERKQAYLKAAAACLIACDKQDIYKKRVRGELQDAAEFESELKDDCKRCSGAGKKELRCYACSGKGKCPVCKGAGQVVAVKYSGFNKHHVSKPCSKCKTSGKCQRCEGKGAVEEKCSSCAGTGKVLSTTVAVRVFHDLCNTIADSMKAPSRKNVAIKSAPPKEKRQDVPKSYSVVEVPPRESADKSDDELKDIRFFSNGCSRKWHNKTRVVFAEKSSGEVNYLFWTAVNARPIATFGDGSKFTTDDIIIFAFPTPEARESWVLAMRSACEKMLEWIDTAKGNNVGHVEKELPESTFRNNMVYASVDYIENTGARYDPYLPKAYIKHFDKTELLRTARKVEFKCFIDSCDNTKFSVTLAFGSGGVFPFCLFTCRSKTLDEIRSSVQVVLQKLAPESLAKIWNTQVMRNSKFDDGIDADHLCGRLSVSGESKVHAEKSASWNREVHADYCSSGWYEFAGNHEIGSRNSLVIKDSTGNWNYTLMIGANGVPRRKHTSAHERYYYDYMFNYHLLVFPTEESRKHWYEVVKKSCGRMLEWVELALKEHVPSVSKPIYDANKESSTGLMAYYRTITKGEGQGDLLSKALRAHIDQSEYHRKGCPVSLICTIRNKSADFKEFRVNIALKCGDECYEILFAESGSYEKIQFSCYKFLCRIAPDVLINAWIEKYGRQDLFK